MPKISIPDELLVREGPRFPLFVEPRFTVTGELKQGHLFLHCSPITMWSRATYIACLEAMNIIKDAAAAHDYDAVYVFIPLRKLKFISMLGFEIAGQYECDGEPFILGCQSTGDK